MNSTVNSIMNPSGEPRSWRIVLTSDTAELADLREVVSQAAATVGFDAASAAGIVLAVDEAIANVIKHGYDGRAGEPIEMMMQAIRHHDRPALEVIVLDRGRQVDPNSIVGRSLEDVRPGGLGTHIIRNTMTEVEYSLRRPAGMSLRMVKVLGTGPDNI